MAGTYKITVKDGDSKYTYNSKTGTYDLKDVDYVATYEDSLEALKDLLDWVSDPEQDTKVTFTYTPKKR